MIRLITLLVTIVMAAGLTACSRSVPSIEGTATPQRIVSLDYCADQYVLKFVARNRILALSPDAEKDFSYMRSAASGIRQVRSSTEDILVLKPDLVVRSYGGGPHATAFLERAGIPVLNVGWASGLDGVMSNVQTMADGLGASEQGKQVVADMQARLDAVSSKSRNQSMLYLTPAGVTTGPGSMIHELISAAGFENYETDAGWRSIPLEELVYSKPDTIAAAYFQNRASQPDAWSSMRHPIAQRQLASQDVVQLDGAWVSCGGWYLMDAVEALAAAGAD
jgi:iron complex transport system substrate-binding protein